MEIKRFNCNYLSENCYVASEGAGAVIVDPGFLDDEIDGLYSYMDAEGLKPEAILLTHAHFDHILATKILQDKYGIPVFLHPDEQSTLQLDRKYVAEENIRNFQPEFERTPVSDGQTLVFAEGRLKFRVIATPGHTPGGVCYYEETDGVLFSGDTLFAGTIGRTDLEYGDYDMLIRSIMEKLILLPGETAVYPGHGRPTSIAAERSDNPFLEPFNEAEEEFDPESIEPVIIHGGEAVPL